MYNEWSLDVFYKGVEDPALQADLKKLEETVARYKKEIAALDGQKPAESLKKIMEIKETMSLLVRRLGGFFSIRRSTNAADTVGAGYTT